MRTRRFAEEQIAYALKQAEPGTKVEEICRKMGINNASHRMSAKFTVNAQL